MGIIQDVLEGREPTIANPLESLQGIDRELIQGIEAGATGIANTIGQVGDGIQAELDAIGLENVEVDRLTNYLEVSLLRSINLVNTAGRLSGDFVSPLIFEDYREWNLRNIKNIQDFSSELAGAVLESLFNISTLPRPLDQHERAVAESVYGDVPFLDLVRIDDASIISDSIAGQIFDDNSRPFVSFYTINTFQRMTDATLIHELLHVWQFENIGPAYIPQARDAEGQNPIVGKYPEFIRDRFANGDNEVGGYDDGYGYGGYEQLQARRENGQGLLSFNLEQQAEIFKHYYEIVNDDYAENDIYIPLYSHFVREASILPLATPNPLVITGRDRAEKIDGTYVEDVTFSIAGNGGNDSLTGSLGNDTLIGDEGNDTLIGNGGDDVLAGRDDNDELSGSGGNDLLIGDDGSDTLKGGLGNDELFGGDGSDILFAGDNSDTLDGGSGDDELFGNDGLDILYADSGADTIDGGAGIDFVNYENVTNSDGIGISIALDGRFFGNFDGIDSLDTILNVENAIGSQYGDLIIGSDVNNFIQGRNGNDVIFGVAGNNTLFGEDGDDSLYGGEENVPLALSGDDVLVGGSGADLLNGGLGNDRVLYTGSEEGVSVNLKAGTASGGEAEGDTLVSIEILLGSSHNDVFIGDDADNVLTGLEGNDFLDGGIGADELDGGDGNDSASYVNSAQGVLVNLKAGTASGGEAEGDTLISIEFLQGSPQNDTFIADDVNNALNGFNGSDLLLGNDGNDTLNGGEGNDSLVGGLGADELNGGLGNDEASYIASQVGVSINLKAGTATGGEAEGDTLISIEELTGSQQNDILIGNDLNNRLTGLNSFDLLSGGAGNDTLDAGVGNDSLEGGLGADELNGGGGDDLATYVTSQQGVSVNLLNGTGTGGEAEGDTLVSIEELTGSEENDTLIGNDLNNRLTGRKGDDSLVGNNGEDIISGREGNDTLEGGGGDDQLFGGQDNDYLDGGFGFDTLDGGDGRDTVSYGFFDGGIDVNLSNGVVSFNDFSGSTEQLISIENIDASQGADNILGTSSRNIIKGLDGRDNLEGLDGDDTLDGGAGNDTLEGGNGADLLTGGSGADLLNGGFSQDTVDYRDSPGGVSVSLQTGTGSRGDAQGDVFISIENVAGSDFNDTLEGDDNNRNNLSGFAGDDLLIGNKGKDFLNGGDGNDVLNGNDDDDVLVSGDGDDTLFGGAGNDLLFGAPGNDLLDGGFGFDTIDGGDGVDTVSYESLSNGIDASLLTGIVSFSSNTTATEELTEIENINGGGGADRIAGDINNNTLRGFAGNDSLEGNGGNDLLLGGAGNDELSGGTGNDELDGGAGRDLLINNGGKDTLTGGSDDDSYSLITGSLTLTGAAQIDNGGTLINDSEGMDNLKFLLVNASGFNPFTTITDVDLSLEFLGEGYTGLGMDGNSLVIDLNRDGRVDSESDLFISNFFDTSDLELELGTGAVETIQDFNTTISSSEILGLFSNINQDFALDLDLDIGV